MKLQIITLFLFVSFVFAGNAVFTEYNAQPDANQVVLSWITKDEAKVKFFIVKRSNDDKTFIELDRVSAKGPGSRYEYVDEDVLFENSNALFYKIIAVQKDETVVSSTESMMVHPNISGIFRTWGAIKAMFR